MTKAGSLADLEVVDAGRVLGGLGRAPGDGNRVIPGRTEDAAR